MKTGRLLVGVVRGRQGRLAYAGGNGDGGLAACEEHNWDVSGWSGYDLRIMVGAVVWRWKGFVEF